MRTSFRIRQSSRLNLTGYEVTVSDRSGESLHPLRSDAAEVAWLYAADKGTRIRVLGGVHVVHGRAVPPGQTLPGHTEYVVTGDPDDRVQFTAVTREGSMNYEGRGLRDPGSG